MNPITLTDRTAFVAGFKGPVPVNLENFDHWPLLTYDFSGEGDGLSDKISRWAATDTPLPFPRFRFWIKRGEQVWYGATQKEDNKWGGVMVGNQTALKIQIPFHWISWAVDHSIVKQELDWAMFNPDTGKLSDHSRAPKPYENSGHKSLHSHAVRAIGFLVATAREYLRADHVARVTPDKPGKSVEWQKAREHYTVIHRKHAANSPRVSAGAVVEQDEDEHLKRLAHSRRAHERLYTHERFVKARGTKILVKATWCGPKEWRDTAGQIYRIVEGRT